MIKKALRNIVALVLVGAFCIAGSGINIYHFCCDACANQIVKLYFGLTNCHDVHSHHHCAEHDHHCECCHHQHDNLDNDCQHLKRTCDGCSITHYTSDYDTTPVYHISPLYIATLPQQQSCDILLIGENQHNAWLTPQHHAPPGGRQALSENCILRI
ncbi:MAG: hypothetical protein Q4D14_02825 [Bacteroidales bacterium]|nr:hypothetical protein [Bacteroidales bacterium]